MKRLIPLVTGEIYHVYNKSIYSYVIFNTPDEYKRMIMLIQFYLWDMAKSFSAFHSSLHRYPDFKSGLHDVRKPGCPQRVIILAYCLMPTHIHFILEQKSENGIEMFMKNIQSGYSQFFNRRHNRRGPLWQGRFGYKHISSESNLQNEINYVHNNPVKDLNCMNAEDWPWTSYHQYIGSQDHDNDFCLWEHRLPNDHTSGGFR